MRQGLSTSTRKPRSTNPAEPTKAVPSRADGSPTRGAAREALVEAARAEFDEAGFDGTDTNRIARRAGYAPQTFYRHFKDKTAIFIEVYSRWLDDEWRDLESAHGKGAEGAARVLLEHHARHREFRRSLRRLTIADETVRDARAASRRKQLGLVASEDVARKSTRPTLARVALLFCIERIADAAADGELADLGLTNEDQVTILSDVIRRLR